ncbi:MAG: hypothetical protein ACOYBC_06940 [Bilifractor sp.]
MRAKGNMTAENNPGTEKRKNKKGILFGIILLAFIVVPIIGSFLDIFVSAYSGYWFRVVAFTAGFAVAAFFWIVFGRWYRKIKQKAMEHGSAPNPAMRKTLLVIAAIGAVGTVLLAVYSSDYFRDIPYAKNPKSAVLTNVALDRDEYTDSEGDEVTDYYISGTDQDGDRKKFKVDVGDYLDCKDARSGTDSEHFSVVIQYLPHSHTILSVSCE